MPKIRLARNEPRMYQPVWEAIKANAQKVTTPRDQLLWIVLECHQSNIAKIRKAISKEKRKDDWPNKEYYHLVFEVTNRDDGMAELKVALCGWKTGQLVTQLLKQ